MSRQSTIVSTTSYYRNEYKVFFLIINKQICQWNKWKWPWYGVWKCSLILCFMRYFDQKLDKYAELFFHSVHWKRHIVFESFIWFFQSWSFRRPSTTYWPQFHGQTSFKNEHTLKFPDGTDSLSSCGADKGHRRPLSADWKGSRSLSLPVFTFWRWTKKKMQCSLIVWMGAGA